ncbi:hypothetical protein [Hyphomonas chukchiensis]|mgnify:FL=1|uniref:hypothetical protein n=1 Tax=Hyphomonas chukchiensis TaxID=1280947 RepID=UPI0030F6C578
MRKLLPLIAVVLLVGCQSKVAEAFDTRQNAGPCPPVGSLYDVSRYVQFADPSDETYNKIAYTAEITDVRSFCRYAGKDPLDAQLEIDFAFGKGPAADKDSHTYPYFVAVTRRNGKVLAKEYFNVEGDFNGKKLAGKTESFSKIKIPRLDESIAGTNFEIVVGFDLTADQLEFNRAGKRFLLNANE